VPITTKARLAIRLMFCRKPLVKVRRNLDDIFKKSRLNNRRYHNRHADNEGIQVEKEKLNMCKSGATSIPTFFWLAKTIHGNTFHK
jgi:hypothetical protein